MSQEVAYEIIKELGGRASTYRIRVRAREKEPFTYLSSMIKKRLKQLVANGRIGYDAKKDEWYIIQ